MNLNGGQNISPAGGAGGGNFLNQLLGGVGSIRQMKNKMQLQQSLALFNDKLMRDRMDKQHEQGLERDAFNHVAKNMAEGLGTQSNFEANRQSYIDTHGEEEGNRLWKEHSALAGIRNGVLGDISLRVQEEKNAADRQKIKTENAKPAASDVFNALKPGTTFSENTTGAEGRTGVFNQSLATAKTPLGQIKNAQGDWEDVKDESGSTTGPLFNEEHATGLLED